MRRSALLAIALFIPAVFAFQPIQQGEWRRSALSRKGLHHVTLFGSFLTPDGKPAAGVDVFLTTGDFRQLPSAATKSDTQGRFQFVDVNSDVVPSISWYSPDYLPGSLGISGESGQVISMNAIRLTPETAVSIALELVGGEPLDEKFRTTLTLRGTAAGQNIVARQTPDGLFVVPHIPFTDGHLEINLIPKGRSETYEAKFHIEPGQRNRLLLIRLRRDTVRQVNEYKSLGKAEVSESLLPQRPIETEFHGSGKLLNPDGTPIAGAIIGVNDFILRQIAPARTVTAADGSFDLRYRAYECEQPFIIFANGNRFAWSSGPSNSIDKQACTNFWRDGMRLTAKTATHLFLKPNGSLPPESLRASWYDPASGWHQFNSLDPWISLFARYQPLQILIGAPGMLPVIHDVKLPSVRSLDSTEAPERVEEAIPIDTSAVHKLIVMANGKPLAGVVVDIESILKADSDSRLPLATYKTDGSGRLRLVGDPKQLVEAFIYADNFEPARLIWSPGSPAEIALTPRSSHVTLQSPRLGQMLRVHSVANPDAVRTFRPVQNDSRHELALAPGAYDFVVYNTTGQVVGSQRITLRADETLALDTSIDQRPTLIVEYGEQGWSANVTTSTPSGMATGFAIYTSFREATAFADKPATPEFQTPQRSVFRLSRAGRAQVQIGRAGLEHTLWREIEVAPGQTVTVRAPKLDAALHGSMRTFKGGIGFSEHGWAGPRMQIIADDPAGWSATVFIPKRENGDEFTLQALPSGDYHVYQHLIGNPASYKDEKGVEHPYSTTLDAWGGVPVKLAPGKPSELKDFIEYEARDLSVTVQDERGQPLSQATLRVRDRMSDAWRQVAEGLTTLAYASNPIPSPPAVRIVNGRATLPAIRHGWLELRVELDDGRTYPFNVQVSDNSLALKLPRDGGAR